MHWFMLCNTFPAIWTCVYAHDLCRLVAYIETISTQIRLQAKTNSKKRKKEEIVALKMVVYTTVIIIFNCKI